MKHIQLTEFLYRQVRYFLIATLLFPALNAFSQHTITGLVTDDTYGNPVSMLEIYFYIPEQGPVGGTLTDQQGMYTFTSDDIFQNDVIHLQAWSFCNGHWDPVNQMIIISGDTTFFDFSVCTDEIQCAADFDYDVTGNRVTFLDRSSGPVSEYYWDFGDGFTSNEINPVHTYEVPGIYSVDLYINAENNCFDMISQAITVGGSYTVSGTIYAGNTGLPAGEVLLFDANNPTQVLANATVDISGTFSFSVDPFSSCFLLALPDVDPGIPHSPVYLPTYSGNTIDWHDAESFYIDNDISFDIQLERNDVLFYGHGKVSGNVFTDGKEVNGMPVFLLEENGAPLDFCYPGSDGTFFLEDIPYGTYLLYPEKAGKNTSPAIITLSESNPEAPWIRIMETPATLKVEYNVGLDDILLEETTIFPNPASSHIFIKSPVKIAEIHLYSSLGELLLMDKTGTNTLKLNLSSVDYSGIAFLVLFYQDKTSYITKIVLQ